MAEPVNMADMLRKQREKLAADEAKKKEATVKPVAIPKPVEVRQAGAPVARPAAPELKGKPAKVVSEAAKPLVKPEVPKPSIKPEPVKVESSVSELLPGPQAAFQETYQQAQSADPAGVERLRLERQLGITSNPEATLTEAEKKLGRPKMAEYQPAAAIPDMIQNVRALKVTSASPKELITLINKANEEISKNYSKSSVFGGGTGAVEYRKAVISKFVSDAAKLANKSPEQYVMDINKEYPDMNFDMDLIQAIGLPKASMPTSVETIAADVMEPINQALNIATTGKMLSDPFVAPKAEAYTPEAKAVRSAKTADTMKRMGLADPVELKEIDDKIEMGIYQIPTAGIAGGGIGGTPTTSLPSTRGADATAVASELLKTAAANIGDEQAIMRIINQNTETGDWAKAKSEIATKFLPVIKKMNPELSEDDAGKLANRQALRLLAAARNTGQWNSPIYINREDWENGELKVVSMPNPANDIEIIGVSSNGQIISRQMTYAAALANAVTGSLSYAAVGTVRTARQAYNDVESAGVTYQRNLAEGKSYAEAATAMLRQLESEDTWDDFVKNTQMAAATQADLITDAATYAEKKQLSTLPTSALVGLALIAEVLLPDVGEVGLAAKERFVGDFNRQSILAKTQTINPEWVEPVNATMDALLKIPGMDYLSLGSAAAPLRTLDSGVDAATRGQTLWFEGKRAEAIEQFAQAEAASESILRNQSSKVERDVEVKNADGSTRIEKQFIDAGTGPLIMETVDRLEGEITRRVIENRGGSKNVETVVAANDLYDYKVANALNRLGQAVANKWSMDVNLSNLVRRTSTQSYATRFGVASDLKALTSFDAKTVDAAMLADLSKTEILRGISDVSIREALKDFDFKSLLDVDAKDVPQILYDYLQANKYDFVSNPKSLAQLTSDTETLLGRVKRESEIGALLADKEALVNRAINSVVLQREIRTTASAVTSHVARRTGGKQMSVASAETEALIGANNDLRLSEATRVAGERSAANKVGIFDTLMQKYGLRPDETKLSATARSYLPKIESMANVGRVEAIALATLADARAKTWSDITGRPIDEWWRTRISDIRTVRGEGTVVAPKKLGAAAPGMREKARTKYREVAIQELSPQLGGRKATIDAFESILIGDNNAKVQQRVADDARLSAFAQRIYDDALIVHNRPVNTQELWIPGQTKGLGKWFAPLSLEPKKIIAELDSIYETMPDMRAATPLRIMDLMETTSALVEKAPTLMRDIVSQGKHKKVGAQPLQIPAERNPEAVVANRLRNDLASQLPDDMTFSFSAEQIGSYLNDAKMSGAARQVVAAILPLIPKDLPITISPMEKFNAKLPTELQFDDAIGFYVDKKEAAPEQIWVELSLAFEDAPASTRFEATLIHELTHAATVNAILNPVTKEQKKFSNDIVAIYDEVIAKYPEAKETYYGLTDPLEFVSEIFSDAAFCEYLKSINVEPKKTVWSKLLEAFASLFGFNPVNNSALATMMNTISAFIVASSKAAGREVNIPTSAGTYTIWGNRLYSSEAETLDARGSVEFDPRTGAALIEGYARADATTFVHELAHVIRSELSPSDMDRLVATLNDEYGIEVGHDNQGNFIDVDSPESDDASVIVEDDSPTVVAEPGKVVTKVSDKPVSNIKDTSDTTDAEEKDPATIVMSDTDRAKAATARYNARKTNALTNPIIPSNLAKTTPEAQRKANVIASSIKSATARVEELKAELAEFDSNEMKSTKAFKETTKKLEAAEARLAEALASESPVLTARVAYTKADAKYAIAKNAAEKAILSYESRRDGKITIKSGEKLNDFKSKAEDAIEEALVQRRALFETIVMWEDAMKVEAAKVSPSAEAKVTAAQKARQELEERKAAEAEKAAKKTIRPKVEAKVEEVKVEEKIEEVKVTSPQVSPSPGKVNEVFSESLRNEIASRKATGTSTTPYTFEEIAKHLEDGLMSDVSRQILRSMAPALPEKYDVFICTPEEIQGVFPQAAERLKATGNGTTMVSKTGVPVVWVNADLVKGSLDSAYQVEGVFMHEMTHAITTNALRRPTTPKQVEFASQINALYKQTMDYAEANMPVNERGLIYGLTNIDEFVAEIFSNPKFGEFLNTIPVESGKTVWTKLLDTFLTLFGLDKAKPTVLSESLAAISQFISPEVISDVAKVDEPVATKVDSTPSNQNLADEAPIAESVTPTSTESTKSKKALSPALAQRNLDSAVAAIMRQPPFSEIDANERGSAAARVRAVVELMRDGNASDMSGKAQYADVEDILASNATKDEMIEAIKKSINEEHGVNISSFEHKTKTGRKLFQTPKGVAGKPIKFKGDLGRLADILTATLVNQDIPTTVVKELVQNSIYGTKAKYFAGGYPEGKKGSVVIDLDETQNEYVIRITDDGVGMSPDIVDTAMFTLGSSNQTLLPVSERPGGFGLAKAVLLFFSDRIRIETTKDNVTTIIDADANTLAALKAGEGFVTPEITTHTTPVPSGTKVEVWLPKELKDAYSGSTKSLFMPQEAIHLRETEQYQVTSTDRYYRDHIPKTKPVTAGKIGPLQIAVTNEDLSAGQTNYLRLRIFSNGAHQFNMELQSPVPMEGGLFVVDIKSSVPPGHPDYPFNAARTGFLPNTRERLTALFDGLVQNQVNLFAQQSADTPSSTWSFISAKKLQPIARKTTELPGSVIKWAEDAEFVLPGAKTLPELDVPGDSSSKFLIDALAIPFEMQPFTSSTGKLITSAAPVLDMYTNIIAKAIRATANEVDARLADYAVGAIFARDTGGLHINPEVIKQKTPKIIALNPSVAINGKRVKSAFAYAYQQAAVLNHEMAHLFVEHHNATFTTKEIDIARGFGDAAAEQFIKDMVGLYTKYNDFFKQLDTHYDMITTTRERIYEWHNRKKYDDRPLEGNAVAETMRQSDSSVSGSTSIDHGEAGNADVDSGLVRSDEPRRESIGGRDVRESGGIAGAVAARLEETREKAKTGRKLFQTDKSETVEVVDKRFYKSVLQEALTRVFKEAKSIKGVSLLNQLKKVPGLKQNELRFTGLEQKLTALGQKPITFDEAMNAAANSYEYSLRIEGGGADDARKLTGKTPMRSTDSDFISAEITRSTVYPSAEIQNITADGGNLLVSLINRQDSEKAPLPIYKLFEDVDLDFLYTAAERLPHKRQRLLYDLTFPTQWQLFIESIPTQANEVKQMFASMRMPWNEGYIFDTEPEVILSAFDMISSATSIEEANARAAAKRATFPQEKLVYNKELKQFFDANPQHIITKAFDAESVTELVAAARTGTLDSKQAVIKKILSDYTFGQSAASYRTYMLPGTNEVNLLLDLDNNPNKEGTAIPTPTDAQLAQAEALANTPQGQAMMNTQQAANTVSMHFGQNNLAHARGNTQIVNGKKYFFLQEIQSDIMQAINAGKVKKPTRLSHPDTADWTQAMTRAAIKYAVETGHEGIILPDASVIMPYNLSLPKELVGDEKSIQMQLGPPSSGDVRNKRDTYDGAAKYYTTVVVDSVKKDLGVATKEIILPKITQHSDDSLVDAEVELWQRPFSTNITPVVQQANNVDTIDAPFSETLQNTAEDVVYYIGQLEYTTVGAMFPELADLSQGIRDQIYRFRNVENTVSRRPVKQIAEQANKWFTEKRNKLLAQETIISYVGTYEAIDAKLAKIREIIPNTPTLEQLKTMSAEEVSGFRFNTRKLPGDYNTFLNKILRQRSLLPERGVSAETALEAIETARQEITAQQAVLWQNEFGYGDTESPQEFISKYGEKNILQIPNLTWDRITEQDIVQAKTAEAKTLAQQLSAAVTRVEQIKQDHISSPEKKAQSGISLQAIDFTPEIREKYSKPQPLFQPESEGVSNKPGIKLIVDDSKYSDQVRKAEETWAEVVESVFANKELPLDSPPIFGQVADIIRAYVSDTARSVQGMMPTESVSSGRKLLQSDAAPVEDKRFFKSVLQEALPRVFGQAKQMKAASLLNQLKRVQGLTRNEMLFTGLEQKLTELGQKPITLAEANEVAAKSNEYSVRVQGGDRETFAENKIASKELRTDYSPPSSTVNFGNYLLPGNNAVNILLDFGTAPANAKIGARHFGEENLAHLRGNTQIINGKKYFFIQEIQSDRMQSINKNDTEFPPGSMSHPTTADWTQAMVRAGIRYAVETGHEGVILPDASVIMPYNLKLEKEFLGDEKAILKHVTSAKQRDAYIGASKYYKTVVTDALKKDLGQNAVEVNLPKPIDAASSRDYSSVEQPIPPDITSAAEQVINAETIDSDMEAKLQDAVTSLRYYASDIAGAAPEKLQLPASSVSQKLQTILEKYQKSADEASIDVVRQIVNKADTWLSARYKKIQRQKWDLEEVDTAEAKQTIASIEAEMTRIRSQKSAMGGHQYGHTGSGKLSADKFIEMYGKQNILQIPDMTWEGVTEQDILQRKTGPAKTLASQLKDAIDETEVIRQDVLDYQNMEKAPIKLQAIDFTPTVTQKYSKPQPLFQSKDAPESSEAIFRQFMEQFDSKTASSGPFGKVVINPSSDVDLKSLFDGIDLTNPMAAQEAMNTRLKAIKNELTNFPDRQPQDLVDEQKLLERRLAAIKQTPEYKTALLAELKATLATDLARYGNDIPKAVASKLDKLRKKIDFLEKDLITQDMPAPLPFSGVQSDEALNLSTREIAKTVPEKTVSDKFYQQMVNSPKWSMIGGFLTGFGADEKWAQRSIPSEARSVFMTAVRPIQETISDISRLITEGSENLASTKQTLIEAAVTGDVKAKSVFEYLNGRQIKFGSGMPSVTSGVNHVDWAVARIQSKWHGMDIADQNIVQRYFDACGIDANGNVKTYVSGLDNNTASAAAAILNKLLVDADKSDARSAAANPGDLFIGMAKQSVWPNIGVEDAPKLHAWLMSLFHAAEVIEPTNPDAGFVPNPDQAIRLVSAMSYNVSSNIEAPHHAAVWLATHGGLQHSRNAIKNQAFGVPKEDAGMFDKWKRGQYDPKMDYAKMDAIARKYGLTATFELAPELGINDVMLPSKLRAEIRNELLHGRRLLTSEEQLAIQFGADPQKIFAGEYKADFITSTIGSIVMGIRKSKVLGLFFNRPQGFTNDTIGIYDAVASNSKFKTAAATTIQRSLQLAITNTPFLSDLLDALGLLARFTGSNNNVAKIQTKIRRALSNAGDNVSKAMISASSAARNLPLVTEIIDGSNEKFLEVNGTRYSHYDLRQIWLQEGVFATFERGQTSEALFNEVTPKTGLSIEKRARRAANTFSRYRYEQSNEAGTFVRVGVASAYLQMGYDPRTAARAAVATTFDYVNSTTGWDKNLIYNIFFPFQAFRKNNARFIMNRLTTYDSIRKVAMTYRLLSNIPDALEAIAIAEQREDGNEYGVKVNELNEDAREEFNQMRLILEEGYSPMFGTDIGRWPDSIKTHIAGSPEAFTAQWQSMDEKGKNLLVYGYRGYDNVPLDIKQSMNMFFSGATRIISSDQPSMLDRRKLLADENIFSTKANIPVDEDAFASRTRFMYDYQLNRPSATFSIESGPKVDALRARSDAQSNRTRGGTGTDTTPAIVGSLAETMFMSQANVLGVGMALATLSYRAGETVSEGIFDATDEDLARWKNNPSGTFEESDVEPDRASPYYSIGQFFDANAGLLKQINDPERTELLGDVLKMQAGEERAAMLHPLVGEFFASVPGGFGVTVDTSGVEPKYYLTPEGKLALTASLRTFPMELSAMLLRSEAIIDAFRESPKTQSAAAVQDAINRGDYADPATVLYLLKSAGFQVNEQAPSSVISAAQPRWSEQSSTPR